VKIIKIGGHSKGSCIVEIESDDKIYIIAGDECYKRECLNKKIPTGASFDKKASREFIEKYSDKKYTVLLCHDE
jgi:glyoxylase-like metal-dependent hydrolase (beta-lactamase superfamily II)